MDIDYFKEYNDYNDHLFGDECIRSVAKVLKEFVDQSSIAFRYGGDEFVFIFIDQTIDEMLQKVNAISRKVKELEIARPTKDDEFLSVTQGVYIQEKEKLDNPIDFIKCADQRLYKAKENRGSICIKIHDTR